MLALIGILIRNSVILIVQIEHLKEAGRPAWDAVVEATEHRMRPILLTAAAASLGLIPISREIFWGPMAYAMMGGIIVGTVLTPLFPPALSRSTRHRLIATLSHQQRCGLVLQNKVGWCAAREFGPTNRIG